MNYTHSWPRRSRTAGFTLLELLVVVGIIGVLMGILIPSLGRARERAREISCMNNQRQLYTACIGFANDNDRMLPCASRIWDNSSNPEVVKKCIWAHKGVGIADLQVGAIWPYMPKSEDARKAAILCPSDTGESAHYSSGYDTTIRNFSYSLHSRMLKDVSGVLYSYQLSKVPKPAETIMIFEELGPNDAYTVDLYQPRRWDDQPTGRHGAGKVNLKTMGDSAERAYRASGRGMYCFFDGHVEGLTPDEIFKNSQWYTNLP